MIIVSTWILAKYAILCFRLKEISRFLCVIIPHSWNIFKNVSSKAYKVPSVAWSQRVFRLSWHTCIKLSNGLRWKRPHTRVCWACFPNRESNPEIKKIVFEAFTPFEFHFTSRLSQPRITFKRTASMRCSLSKHAFLSSRTIPFDNIHSVLSIFASRSALQSSHHTRFTQTISSI